ncbi:hypothetical protein RHSIM_Rhsim04G0044300 [Rhododendron simsii]|uniref:Uncharacterized protein n=1 Tax=Rhododendron simsii TaxID=118357 RepID=A0A834H0R7_RHOSS|nr:hypothetical protein RHSIM_Rhsim04G0044300 [Rhododendron simsii]
METVGVNPEKTELKLNLVDIHISPSPPRNARMELVTKINLPKGSIPTNIIGSCNGLLCLGTRYSDGPIRICNPLLCDLVTLPNCPSGRSISSFSCAFGYSPMIDQYKVVRCFGLGDVYPVTGRETYEAEIYTLGEGSWRSIGKIPTRICSSSINAFLNGSLHWVNSYSIYCFDFGSEQLRSVPKPSEFDARSEENTVDVVSVAPNFDPPKVWVRPYLDSVRNVVFQADSDSVLTKGLAALLVQGLSGRPVEDIIRVLPDFVVLLGLQQRLTPSRNNGFLNMLRLMQKKALQLYVEAEKGGELGSELSSLSMSAENPVEDLDSGSKVGIGIGDLKLGKAEVAADESDSNSDRLGSRGERIKEELEAGLSLTELKVDDISHQRARHEGVRGSDSETHFNVKVVSKEFEGKGLVKRHRLIHDLLQDELQSGLHALSIVAKTPSEVDIK